MENIEFRIGQIILLLIGLGFIISGGSIVVTAGIEIVKNTRHDYILISPKMIFLGGIILILISLIPLTAYKILKPSHPRFIRWGIVIINIAMVLVLVGPFFFH